MDGILNVDKICDADPPLREVLSVGATWIWVPRTVFKHYPGLDELAQSSGNYRQNASKSEHDGQIIFKVIRQIEDGKSFDEIKTTIMKNRVKNVETLPGMYNFLRKYGSLDGKNMDIAKETASFIRGECNSSRHVDAELWDKLGTDIKGINQYTRLRNGALAILYVDKNNRVFSGTDIKNLGSKDLQVEAVEMESAIQEMSDSMKAGSDTVTPEMLAELCRFSAACFAMLLNKLKVDVIARIVEKYEIETDELELGHLQWYFTEQLSIIKKIPNADTAFSEFALKVKKVTNAANNDAVDGIRNNSIDNTATLLSDCGWKIGELVQYKTLPAVYKLLKFADGKVYLTAMADDKKREVPMSEF